MMNLQQLWPQRNATVLCFSMLLHLVGAACGLLASTHRLSTAAAWRITKALSSTALIFAATCCTVAVVHASALSTAPRIDSFAFFHAWHLSFRFDLVESLMLLLVSFLGWVIVMYSRTYMAGDPKQPAYILHLMLTLAAVNLLVVTNNLLLFLAAWILTGLFLHGLLTLYPHRQIAIIVAHKKFLASRLADVTLLCAVLLLASTTGSVELDKVAQRISTLHPIPPSLHLAALLLATSAIIKCAQLPLHGWLIQVMEAPTPVSALLHAGVVNLGGFMLIRLAPVMNTTHAAQALLVGVGCLTATVASLVMTTRISIKVNLAWSTCAQMGFMLLECGLGLYGLAFLHLLAHSLYKAHAFLGSGDTVKQAQWKRNVPAQQTPGFLGQVLSGLCGILIASLAALLWKPAGVSTAVGLFCIPVVGLAIAGIVAPILSGRGFTTSLILAMIAIGVSLVYFGFDDLLQKVVAADSASLAVQRPLLMVCASCFALLYLIQMLVRCRPNGSFARALYPWFYAGLYLDELFTRTTFRIWPARRVSQLAPGRHASQPFEERSVQL